MPYYTDTPLDFEEQLELLRKNGLAFLNEQKALHTLRHISYFRLKSYLMPFMSDKSTHTFKQGATFETAYELYKFDSRLRKLIAAELEKIEVSVRTQMACILAQDAGIYWFADSANFQNSHRHTATLACIKAELERSDDDQILHFKALYDNPFPPAWMTMEISSFGTLSMLYKLLRPGYSKRRIANFYGVSDSVFESWLHSIVYVRNICAHHSRLWNRTLRVQPLFPRKTVHTFIGKPMANNRLYYLLSVIQYLLRIVNPATTFASRLQALFADYPQVDISAMGFPRDWAGEALWNTFA